MIEPSPAIGATRPHRPDDANPVCADQVGWPRIAVLGGGTGLPTVLRGLVDLFHAAPGATAPREHLSAVVTVTDDGGSSGWLRRELGMLPPGDVRNCLAALSAGPFPLPALLQHRFVAAGTLTGHPVGNLLLAALTQLTGDFATAVRQLSEALNLRGCVLPATAANVTLRAEFDTGDIVDGETAIVSHAGGRITRLSLSREANPLPEVIRTLINADAIVVGPGSLYTSILPVLLIRGVSSTLSGVNAVRIYVANLMTEPGETDGFSLDDHLRVIRVHTRVDLFDYVLVNRRAIDPPLAALYRQRGAEPVRCDLPSNAAGRAEVVERELGATVEGGKIRHAPGDLARAILELATRGRPSTAAVAGIPRPRSASDRLAVV